MKKLFLALMLTASPSWADTPIADWNPPSNASTTDEKRRDLDLELDNINAVKQPIDADLTCLAALASAADKLPYFTGVGTCATTDFSSFIRTLIDDANATTARATLGLIIGTDVQAFDSDLFALASTASTGLYTVTGGGTSATRTITAPAAGFTVANGNGVAGNPTFSLANDLGALEALAGTNNLYYRSGVDTWTSVTIGGLMSFSGGALNIGDAELTALAGLTSAVDTLGYFSGSGTAAATPLTTFGRSLIDDAAAVNARTTLGLTIGTDVQAQDAELSAIAGLTSAANKGITFTGIGTASTFDLSAYALTLVDDASAAAAQSTLGLVIGTNVQAFDTDLTTWAGVTPSANGQSLVAATNYAAMRTLLTLVPGTDVQAFDTDLSTWATLTPSINAQSLVTAANYAAMRTLLTLTPGTDIQAFDSDLSTIAGLTATTDSFIQSKASAWTTRTVAQVKTDLGLTGTNSGDQTIALSGDVVGSGTGSFGTTIQPDAVALGGDTTGNYQNGNTAGTGIAVTQTPAEAFSSAIALDFSDAGASPALNLDESRFTSNATTPGYLVFEGDTADTFETRIAVTDPTADRLLTIPNADSNPVQPQTCTSTDKISGISASGVITCSADAGGAGSGDNVTVNGVSITDIDLDDATPVAPTDGTNVKWQKDASSPANTSAYVAGIDIRSAGDRISPAVTSPATPGTDKLNVYASKRAGMMVETALKPLGLAMPQQDAMWNSNIVQWYNGAATAGLWTNSVGAGAGTYTQVMPTATSVYTSMKRGRYANVVTTANQVLGQRNTDAMFSRGSIAGAGGFLFHARAGFDVWTNGGRFFAGLHTATTVISADPSALANTAGFAIDAADNGLIYFITRDATTSNKVSTGFTAVTGKGYDLTFYAAPNGSSISWRIVDINTGTEASGTTSTNLPVTTTMLTAGVLASNGALTPVTSIQLGIHSIYVQTDY
jgi:hypothetical protein